MSAQAIISRYKHISGNDVSGRTLREFHDQIQSHLDRSGPGQHTKTFSLIRSRLAKALKTTKPDEIVQVQISEIDFTVPVKKKLAGPERKHEPKKDPATVKKTLDIPSMRKEILDKKSKAGVTFKDLKGLPLRVPKSVKKAMKETRKSGKKKVKRKHYPLNAYMPTPPMELRPVIKKGKKSEKLSGVNYQYTTLDLGPFENDFHRMYSDTVVQIWGMPGHGKTYKLLQLVKHFAKQNRVLYVAREEHGRSVFAEKLFELDIEDKNGLPIDPNSKNMRFRKYLKPEDMEWAQIIFADSATSLELTPASVERLMEKYPNRNWWLILQSIKSGNFAGSQKWEHLVDVAGEVYNREIILRKNRLDKDNAKKAHSQHVANMIEDKKQQNEIRQAVKMATKKEPEQSEPIMI